MLNANMLSVIILNVIILNVAAPSKHLQLSSIDFFSTKYEKT